MPEAWGAKGSLRTSGSAWWSRFGQAHGHQVAPSAPRGRPCGLCLAWGSGEQEQEAQGVIEPGQPPPPGPGGRPGLSSRAWGSLWKGPSLHSPGRHGPSWDLPAVHPCGQAVEPSRGLSPVSPAEGAGHPPPHPVPLPATRWGALQQTQLWPLLAGRSAPTLGAHTFPGPSPPDSPSGAAWTPPPPGSPPRSLLALGPALRCASCPSQPSSQLPWAGGRWVPSRGLSCRSGWPPLQSHATQLSHLQSERNSMCSGGSESLWAFRGKSKVPPNVGWQSPRSSALT